MTLAQQWVECDTCEGTGEIVTDARWRGEAYGCLTSHHCPDCAGEGGRFEEPLCLGCAQPLDANGFCPSCEEYALTVCEGNPLKRRVA